MSETNFGGYAGELWALFREGDAAVAEKHEESTHLQTICDLVAALGRGDFDRAAGYFTDDAELEIHGAPELPWVRSAVGRVAVHQAMLDNFATVTDQRPSLVSVVAQGDQVVIVSTETGVLLATGARYAVRGVHRYVFVGQRISRVEELIAST